MSKFRLFWLEFVVIGFAMAGAFGVIVLNYSLGDAFLRTTSKVAVVWRNSTNVDGQTFVAFQASNNSKDRLWYSTGLIVQCLGREGWTNYVQEDNVIRDHGVANIGAGGSSQMWVEFDPMESPWRVGVRFLNTAPKKTNLWFKPKRVDSVIVWSSPYEQNRESKEP